ncbi:MAG: GspH/FimT family pseudopilin [Cyanobacteria bacterium]|nr:GspH/FimT family pseudopilin [Cyanobacteriota bacterium]
MTLTELLLGLSLLGLMGSVGLTQGSQALADQRLEHATRLLDQGLQRARREAQRRGEPCGLHLSAAGWQTPQTGTLPPCMTVPLELPQGVRVAHNFPELLRFTANGLVLDGGTAVISAGAHTGQRCLVMSLPLGVTRLGQMRSGRCEAS